MKYVRLITTVLKILGGLGFVTQFLDAQTAATVVLGASIVKDALRTLGDYLDDGKTNGSFKP